MLHPESTRPRPLLLVAFALSLLLHGIVLFMPTRPPSEPRPPGRLEARLQPRQEMAPAEVSPPPATKPPAGTRHPVLAVDKGGKRSIAQAPKWTRAQKEEMNKFLDELAGQAKVQPSLAQRSLASAREMGRQQAHQEAAEGSVQLERIPGSPPVDPFSLELYVDALVKKLNRSAAYVRNDPRNKGVRNASVQFRINPDGSLKNFKVVNAGDQQDEIAFIKSVVERAIPFASFPRDIAQSAGSLAMTICILPGRGDGSLGFSRLPPGQSC